MRGLQEPFLIPCVCHVLRFVMPAPYRTFFGWFLHYVAFGWLRPFTICGALTSGLAACI